MKSVFAVFSEVNKAKEAVEHLLRDGYKEEQMNSIVQETVAKNYLDVNRQEIKVEMTDALGGKRIRGLSALFGGQQAVFTSDTGRVYAAGPVATTIAGSSAGSGFANTGLEGSLERFALPKESAHIYQKSVAGGGLLFWIRVDDEKVYQAVSVIKDHQGASVVTIE